MTDVSDDLRTAQATATKRRIARAVIEVIVRDGAVALSYPAVAEQAGVSLRTVYRHYPNKEELVLAATSAGSEQAVEAFPPGSRNIGNMREFLPLLWAELERGRDLVAVQHATATGQEVRRERLQLRRDEFRTRLAEDFAHVPDASRERMANIMTALMGSTLLFDLVDHLDVEVAEAAFLAAYAIEAVAERATRDGAVR